MAMGDFDGDGDRDIVTASSQNRSVSVLLNNGNGFNAARPFTTGSGAAGGHTAVLGWYDYTGDGNRDIVVTNPKGNSVTLLPGNGNGTFAAPRNFTVGVRPLHVYHLDFDGDGNQDLVTANAADNTVSFLRGTGTSTAFAPAAQFTTGVVEPSWVWNSDVDHDGQLDLVVAGRMSNNLSVLFNNGKGGVNPRPMIIDPSHGQVRPVCISGGAFNADGQWDCVVVDSVSGTITVLLGLV
jgi:hypothetical protein